MTSISACRKRASVSRSGLGGADIHVAVDQRRVDATSLIREALGRAKRGSRLARGGRAHEQDGGRCGTHLPRMKSLSSSSIDSCTRSAGRGCTGRHARSLPSGAAARSFRQRELAVGAHSAMAGHRRQEFVAAGGHQLRYAVLAQFGDE